MGEEGTGDEITRTAILRGVVAWLVGQRPGRVRAGAPPTHSTDGHSRADDSRSRFGSRQREQETRSIGGQQWPLRFALQWTLERVWSGVVDAGAVGRDEGNVGP
jgi:hypothetical protein